MATDHDALRGWADTMATLHEDAGWTGATPHRLLIEHGEEATFSPLPDGESCGVAKNCYGNATKRALLGAEGLTYYEGLALVDGRPIEHAWCQDADGRVYDVTLRHNDPSCPYCDGEGKLHPADHYDYEEDPENEWDEFEEEEISCEMCSGSGDWEAIDRTGTAYLGIAIPADVLRAAVMETQTYGVLFTHPGKVARWLGQTTS